MNDLTNVDLYELLDILPSATAEEVKKAYRKKALKCHPDKNPDNPKAAELFHQLSNALEVLTDVSARAAYDKVINAKKAAELRNRELDSKRKKLKEDLEAREKQAQADLFREKTAQERFKAEIERLQKEGSKQLEEEIEFVRQQVEREKFSNSKEVDPSLYRLKLSWKIQSNDTNEVYNHNSLNKIFSKYGEITALVISNKKKGSALLEFTSSLAAMKAQQLEKGFMSNPLTVSWLSGAPPSSVSQQTYGQMRGKGLNSPVVGANVFPAVPTDDHEMTSHRKFPVFSSAPDLSSKIGQEKKETDFESIVLSRMRQAQEEKRRAEEKESETQEKGS